jgi:hypothetical protein
MVLFSGDSNACKGMWLLIVKAKSAKGCGRGEGIFVDNVADFGWGAQEGGWGWRRR